MTETIIIKLSDRVAVHTLFGDFYGEVEAIEASPEGSTEPFVYSVRIDNAWGPRSLMKSSNVTLLTETPT